jgi:hypothetical protein
MSARREPAERIIQAVIAVPVSLAEAAQQLVRIGRDRRCRPAAPASAPSSASAAVPTVPTVAVVGSETPQEPAPVEPVSELPIDGYDHLSARQILDRLGGLSADELAAVADHERAHRRRQTVLQRIAQLA